VKFVEGQTDILTPLERYEVVTALNIKITACL
jgi:hypothetical protein